MKCRVPAIAASALAAAMALAFPSGAHAISKVPIRSYTEQGSIRFAALEGDKAYFSRNWGNEKVELTPHLAFSDNWHSQYRLRGVHSSSGQVEIVGGRLYTRTGNGRWTVKRLTAKQRATWVRQLNPYVALAKFGSLPGVKRVAMRHFRVTGTYAKIGSFLSWEYGLTAASFHGSNIKTFIIDLWLDSNGRPAKIAAVARSPIMAFSVTETFANYNKPVIIRVP